MEKVILKNYYNNKDIMENVGRILNHNDELERAYQQIKVSKNSLNVHFKLYKLLQLCGLECNVEDFINLKTKPLDKYQKAWKEICKINNWKVIE